MSQYLCESQHPPCSLKPSLTVTPLPTDLLKPDPANARIHGKKQIRQIARSIETFGFNVPVLVDANMKVIAGHGRLLAARQLGLPEVPTISLEHLTPARARNRALAALAIRRFRRTDAPYRLEPGVNPSARGQLPSAAAQDPYKRECRLDGGNARQIF
jgi:hypothetical protein